MACRIDRKREISPISSAQVSAVMGPTPGTVLSRLILSASKGSRCSELTRAYSVFCSRTTVSRLSFGRGTGLLHARPRWSRATRGSSLLCAAAACCSSLRFPSADPKSIFHLHHLPHQQVSIAQGSASIANLGRCHVALWQEVAAQAVGDLAGINLIVLLFLPLRWRAASADAPPSLVPHAAADDRRSSR